MKDKFNFFVLITIVTLMAGCGSPARNSNLDNDPAPPPAEILPDNFNIYFIDVGYGDCVLVRTNQDHYILIDGGPSDSSNRTINFLNALGVTSLYRLISSHPNSDHYGEMSDILSQVSAEAFIYANFPWTESAWLSLLNQIATASIPTIEARDGYTFTLDNLTFQVYFPPTSEFIAVGDTDNANSLAIKISNQSGVDFLTCGDLESDGLSQMISGHGSEIDVELLKVNHHGATDGTTQAFLTATSPTDAFICVGTNSSGRPNSGVLSLLATNSVNVYRTDNDGTITVSVEGGSYTIATTEH